MKKNERKNSHLSKVAVVGLAGLDVLVGSGLGGRGHGGEGRAGEQQGRDGGRAVFFKLRLFFIFYWS